MSRSLRITPFIVFASLLAGAACDSGGDGGAEPLVDETGFLKPSHIVYTAVGALIDTPRAVTVVGLPGAVTSLGGELTLTIGDSATPSVATVAADGSFVVGASAALDDVATLRYVLGARQQRIELVLDDALELPAPRVQSGSSGSGNEGVLQVIVSANGTLTVDLAQLLSRPTNVIVFNKANGTSAEATPDEREVTLPGGSGDIVCVFALDEAGASPTLCAVAM